MTHLDTAYKLGSYQAAHDFETAMRDAEYDNPTAPPPKAAGYEIDVDGLVKRVHEKLSSAGSKGSRMTRGPVGGSGGSRFKALKKKLKAKGRK